MTKRFIHYSCQKIDNDDIDAVIKVLRSDWLTQGPDIERFEQSVSSYCQAAYGVAVANATAGLHLSCLALGVGSGDIVWTSPMSFVASANCARYLNAEIDFVDVDPQTGNMSPQALQIKLEAAVLAGRLPKVLIPVHYAGRACDMAAINALKERFGFKIIEDSAHALGANYTDGLPVGSSKTSDATIFSFHPVKPITTGEGGMVVTHNKELADKVRSLRSHGIFHDATHLQQKNMPLGMGAAELGYKLPHDRFQAALGVSQMRKLDGFITARRKLAERYQQLLGGLKSAHAASKQNSGWHLYVIQLENSRDEIFKKMRENHIGVNVHYIPIHMHPYYRDLGFKVGQFPAAESFFAKCLSLPLHQGMAVEDQDYVVDIIKDAIKS